MEQSRCNSTNIKLLDVFEIFRISRSFSLRSIKQGYPFVVFFRVWYIYNKLLKKINNQRSVNGGFMKKTLLILSVLSFLMCNIIASDKEGLNKLQHDDSHQIDFAKVAAQTTASTIGAVGGAFVGSILGMGVATVLDRLAPISSNNLLVLIYGPLDRMAKCAIVMMIPGGLVGIYIGWKKAGKAYDKYFASNKEEQSETSE